MIKGVLKAAVHGRCYRYVRVVHEFKEGGSVVGGDVVFSWVVFSLIVENPYVSVELEFGKCGVRGVLVRTVIRGSCRQVWRGGGEVVVVVQVIVEMRGGEGWGAETPALFVYIVVAVHDEEEELDSVTCVVSLTPPAGCVGEIEMDEEIGGEKKKGLREEEQT